MIQRKKMLAEYIEGVWYGIWLLLAAPFYFIAKGLGMFIYVIVRGFKMGWEVLDFKGGKK